MSPSAGFGQAESVIVVAVVVVAAVFAVAVSAAAFVVVVAAVVFWLKYMLTYQASLTCCCLGRERDPISFVVSWFRDGFFAQCDEAPRFG